MNTIQKLSHKFALQQSVRKVDDPPFNPIADAQWICNQSNLPWIKLTISVPYEIIKEEIKNIENYFVLHRSDYNEHIDWQSFCIHGKSFDATREDSYYDDDRPYDWTPEAVRLMPQTVAYFKQWPRTNFSRIRVMKLAPKGIISVHRDQELPGKLAPINIAITQPSTCKFVMEKHGTVPFTQGSAFILNVSNRHTVINDSDEYRYHIIIHQTNNAAFDKLLVESYNNHYAQ
jgi:hypothetical protein